jgi:hypothetical protein
MPSFPYRAILGAEEEATGDARPTDPDEEAERVPVKRGHYAKTRAKNQNDPLPARPRPPARCLQTDSTRRRPARALRAVARAHTRPWDQLEVVPTIKSTTAAALYEGARLSPEELARNPLTRA